MSKPISDFGNSHVFKSSNYAPKTSPKHKYNDSGHSFATDARARDNNLGGREKERSNRFQNLLDSGNPVDPRHSPRLKASPGPRAAPSRSQI
jgi:hypothetical protein